MLSIPQILQIKQLAYNCIVASAEYMASTPLNREAASSKLDKAKQEFDDYLDNLVSWSTPKIALLFSPTSKGQSRAFYGLC